MIVEEESPMNSITSNANHTDPPDVANVTNSFTQTDESEKVGKSHEQLQHHKNQRDPEEFWTPDELPNKLSKSSNTDAKLNFHSK